MSGVKTTLKEGQRAPSFALEDKDGCEHRLEDIKGKYRVLFFYPKDSTPGCTIETVSFNKELPRFIRLGATLVGISGGDKRSKSKFCAEHKLKILLLSDTDFKVAGRYGVFGKKSFMGRSYMGIYRTTFVLDENGKALRIFHDVKPEGHAQQVLEFLKQVSADKSSSKESSSAAKTKRARTKKSATNKIAEKKS